MVDFDNKIMKKNIKNIITKPIFIYSVAVFIVVVASIVIFLTLGRKDTNLSSFLVKRDNITDVVSLTGQVKASEGVDLAFQLGGRVSSHYVNTGDAVYSGETLVSLENADLVANVHQAEANVKIAQAKLDEMNAGARAEDLSIAQSTLSGAQISLVEKIRDAYAKSDDAIRNQADQLYINPKTSNVQLIFQTDFSLQNDLESGRASIETMLNTWSSSILTLNNESDLDSYSGTAIKNLSDVSSFLNKLAYAVNELSPTYRISQVNISSWKSNISLSRTSIDMAISSLNTASVAYDTAQNEFSLVKEGATKEQLTAEEGQLDSAKASLELANASLSKTIIYAPFNGRVSKDNVTVGATVSAGSPLITIISDQKSEIEVNISEADISRVKVGDLAEVTLDAYGNSTKFDAKVVSVDSSESIVGGVSVYQAKLYFDKEDTRIKDGMTANISVISDTHSGVLVVPFSSLLQKNNFYTVLVDNGNKNPEERSVEIGLKGNDGTVEIISGLKEGEKVLVY